MRNLCKLTLTLALAALLASPALAQPRRPGGGGRGGFRANLLMNKSVQEELKISSDQKTKLEGIQKKMREAFTGGRDLSREERQEKMQKVMKEIGAETKKVRDSLTSEQQKRLKQIETQTMGIRAFSDKDVQTALKLTDEQKTAVKEIMDDTQKKVREETKDLGRADFQKRREISQKLNKEALGQIASKLTKEQKTTWKELTGKPFEVKFEQRTRPGGRRPSTRRDI